MTKGLGCPLAIGDTEEEEPCHGQNLWLVCPSSFPLGLINDGWSMFGHDDRSFRRCIFTLWTNSSWEEWGFFL